MPKVQKLSVLLCVGLWVCAAASGQAQKPGAAAGMTKAQAGGQGTVVPTPRPLLASSVDPELFGIQDYTITVVAAAQFQAFWAGGLDLGTPVDFNTYSRTCTDCLGAGVHYFANLDIPAGAVIDFIGVNTATTGDAVMGFTLLFKDHLGGWAPLTSFSFPAHGFATDMAGPLGILVPGNHDRSFILDVEQAPSADLQYFGYVEVWWRRAVSDPPATPTFGDVPSLASVLPVHRGLREVRRHRRMRRRQFLSRHAVDSRPDGRFPLQGARSALVQLEGNPWGPGPAGAPAPSFRRRPHVAVADRP